jgi:hypothetical protein
MGIAACSVPVPAGSTSDKGGEPVRAKKTREPIALCGVRRYIPSTTIAFSSEVDPVRVEKTRPNKSQAAAGPQIREPMRAEVERLVEEIKQSVGLLRRHL